MSGKAIKELFEHWKQEYWRGDKGQKDTESRGPPLKYGADVHAALVAVWESRRELLCRITPWRSGGGVLRCDDILKGNLAYIINNVDTALFYDPYSYPLSPQISPGTYRLVFFVLYNSS